MRASVIQTQFPERRIFFFNLMKKLSFLWKIDLTVHISMMDIRSYTGDGSQFKREKNTINCYKNSSQ